jgi:hypothetical protein
MVAGLAFVAVSPASAAATLSFSGTIPTQTAGIGFNVTVNVAPTPTGDTINITSTCTLSTGNLSATTDGSGNATFTGVYVKLGSSCTLTATDATGSNSGATAQSNSFTVTPAAANKIAYTTGPPTAGAIGVPLTAFKVSVEDTYGNVITTGTGASDTFTISTASAGCTLAGTDTGTASLGVATFSNVYFSTGTSCTLTATDTLNSFATVTSPTIGVVSNTPAELGFTTEPPTTVAAGTVLPAFAVSVEASNGVALQGGVSATDVIVLTSACALTGTTAMTAANDVATFSAVTIKTGSNCQLVATDTTRTLATATSTVVALTAGGPAQVVFTTVPPTSETTAGTTLTTFQAAVEDANGNVVTTGTGSTDTIAITSPCTLGGTATAAAIAGVATFSALNIGVTGACVLTASDSTRALVAATHTTNVGAAQTPLTIGTVKGNVGTSLTLSTAGGSGTGAVTYTLAAGSSAGCVLTGNSLHAARAGTCVVTATKAGGTTYIAANSAATTVTFILPYRISRVVGALFVAQTRTITLVGSGFYGAPRVISNVPGVTARVIRDTGAHLVVRVSVRPGVRVGIHSFTVILANGKRAAVRYNLR